jgi:hypothetical protein
MSFNTVQPNDRETFLFLKQYLAAARELGQKFQNSLRSEVGPIEAKP